MNVRHFVVVRAELPLLRRVSDADLLGGQLVLAGGQIVHLGLPLLRGLGVGVPVLVLRVLVHRGVGLECGCRVLPSALCVGVGHGVRCRGVSRPCRAGLGGGATFLGCRRRGRLVREVRVRVSGPRPTLALDDLRLLRHLRLRRPLRLRLRTDGGLLLLEATDDVVRPLQRAERLLRPLPIESATGGLLRDPAELFLGALVAVSLRGLGGERGVKVQALVGVARGRLVVRVTRLRLGDVAEVRLDLRPVLAREPWDLDPLRPTATRRRRGRSREHGALRWLLVPEESELLCLREVDHEPNHGNLRRDHRSTRPGIVGAGRGACGALTRPYIVT